MAQISIQYALDCQVSEWDEQRIKMALGEINAIHDIRLNGKTGMLCVDFDNTLFSEKELERRIIAMNYPVCMIDAITFK